jgi:hypothetical protein
LRAASPPPGEEQPRLADVVEKSGHRTVRAALDPQVDVVAVLPALADEGLLLWEWAHPRAS